MGVVFQVRPPPSIKREPSPAAEWEDTYDVQGVGTEYTDVEGVGCDGVMGEESGGGDEDVAMVKEEIEEVKDEKMAINVYVGF